MNSVFIESNRKIAEARINSKQKKSSTLTDVDNSISSDNAKWRTTLDSGIVLKKGDRITMEACALNIDGAGTGQFQQFNGLVDVPDDDQVFRKDNEMEIEIAYYVTNNIQFNFPLPSGKHTIDYDPRFRGIFGSPSFDGRTKWEPNYTHINYNDSRATGGGVMVPDLNTVHWFYGKNKPYITNTIERIGPGSNKQDIGGYFFLNMDYNQFIVPAAASAIAPAYSLGQAEAAAFSNWNALVPFCSMPGVQFGSYPGPTLPLPFSPEYESSAPGGQALSSLNMNTEVRDRENFINSGYYPSGKNGCANPLLIQNKRLFVKPNNTQTNGFGSGQSPLNYSEFTGTDAVNDYSWKNYIDSPTYTGSYLNHNPNCNRLYCPLTVDPNENSAFQNPIENCKGPFYDIDIAPPDPTSPPGPGEATYNVLTWYNNPNGLQFAKIRILYNTDIAHYLGVDVSDTGNNLPSQGVRIESEGSSGEANRRIEVFQTFGELPPIFDAVLFSPGGIVK